MAEIAGIVLGLPGLCALLLNTGLKGYTLFTDVQNSDDDINDCLSNIQVEYQKLRDWDQRTKHITRAITLTEKDPENHRLRYRLVVNNLARIACVFNTIAEMEDKYRDKSGSDSRKSSPSRPRRIIDFARRHFPHRRSDPGDLSPQEKIRNSRELTRSPAFGHPNIVEIIPEDIELEKLALLATKYERSVSRVVSLKWAILDKQRMEQLHQKLKGYNQNLVDITNPLLIAEGGFRESTSIRLIY